MGKYAEDARELLQYVGGKENIAAVSHCMTRMRFVLHEPKKADIEQIEGMKIVKGSFTQTGQFQVIIGNTVADFYNDFTAVSGLEGVSRDAVKNVSFISYLFKHVNTILKICLNKLILPISFCRNKILTIFRSIL